MGFPPLPPQGLVRQCSHGQAAVLVRGHIGVAGWMPRTDIDPLARICAAADQFRRPQKRLGAAVWAADFNLFHSIFSFLFGAPAQFTQKADGRIPDILKQSGYMGPTPFRHFPPQVLGESIQFLFTNNLDVIYFSFLLRTAQKEKEQEIL
jgi:hypothetical protein